MNVLKLGRDVKRRRRQLGLSLRHLKAITGVAFSTLSRLENLKDSYTGGVDVDNLQRLTSWLQVSVLDYIEVDHQRPVIYVPSKPLPDVIDGFLNSDARLNKRAVIALSLIFRCAYEYMSNREKRAVKT